MRPIDLQDNLSKAPLAGREQQILQAGAELGQRHLAQELDRERVVDHSRTRQTAARDGPENRVDRRSESPPRRRRQPRRSTRGAATQPADRPRPAAPPATPTSGHIDVVA